MTVQTVLARTLLYLTSLQRVSAKSLVKHFALSNPLSVHNSLGVYHHCEKFNYHSCVGDKTVSRTSTKLTVCIALNSYLRMFVSVTSLFSFHSNHHCYGSWNLLPLSSRNDCSFITKSLKCGETVSHSITVISILWTDLTHF